MRLDAAGADARRTYPDKNKEWRGGYIEGYDPDAHGILYHALRAPHYDDDLRAASAQYWAEHDMDGPPAPSYEDDKLGRMMDVYGCQAMLRRDLHDWRKMFWRLALGSAIVLAVGTDVLGVLVLGFPLVAAGIIALVSYRFMKKRRYMKYYRAQDTILRSRQPLWVPYERSQLRKMSSDQRFQWP